MRTITGRLIGTFVVLMASAPVYAQTTAAPVAPAATPAADEFSSHKQKLLENIGEHIVKMQKKQSCIRDAADEKALDACFSAENSSAQADGKAAAAALPPAKQ